MATMNLSLPDQMNDWVEAKTRSGHYWPGRRVWRS